MQIETGNTKQRFIIAVSGGVDSVVLLHKIVNNLTASQPQQLPTTKPPAPKIIVAHFDHGIRTDSAGDAEFVKKLAEKYDVEYISERAELGADASEEQARNARYAFLMSAMLDNKASAIVTAHHEDDVLETMIVNILRGTTARGLRGFTMQNIVRPLLNMTKQDILEYAKQHGLEWREDSTNTDETYTRNYVRAHIIPKLGKERSKLLAIRTRVLEHYIEIDDQITKLLVATMQKNKLIRSRFVTYPYVVQKELMVTLLRMRGAEVDSVMVDSAVLAAKTLRIGKHIELSKDLRLYSEKDSITIR